MVPPKLGIVPHLSPNIARPAFKYKKADQPLLSLLVFHRHQLADLLEFCLHLKLLTIYDPCNRPERQFLDPAPLLLSSVPLGHFRGLDCHPQEFAAGQIA